MAGQENGVAERHEEQLVQQRISAMLTTIFILSQKRASPFSSNNCDYGI